MYDAESGDLHWKARPNHHFASDRNRKIFNTQFAGVKVRGFDGGYLSACISGYTTRRAHRIIWKLLYDEEPSHIDHIDGCRTNNKLPNLRKASPTLNSRNRLPSKGRATPVGVSATKNGTFSTGITIAGRRKHLGAYSSAEEASKVYQLAKLERDINMESNVHT